MGDDFRDPIDHARTTRQHAGETMKNGTNAPGLLAVALGVVSMVVGLAAFATANPRSGSIAISVAVVAALIGTAWLFLSHRRVRRNELRYAAENPDADAPPPAS